MALDNTTNPAMDEGKPATNFSENGDNSNSVNPAENNNNTEGSADTNFAKKDDPEKRMTIAKMIVRMRMMKVIRNLILKMMARKTRSPQMMKIKRKQKNMTYLLLSMKIFRLSSLSCRPSLIL